MTPRREREAWPGTVDEAVEAVLQRLSPAFKETLRAGTREGAQSRNLSLGLWIRNELGMWRGNRELVADCARRGGYESAQGRGMDPDLASHFLLGILWDRLKESDREDDASV